ncbi:hypothetical protein [Janthinobacterium sp.]|uniref:hypothetical protein n=1 Tax=Janthinobacterium sp. TaxID=1871054 RepID=UPI00293D3EBA|nr:hypothetical protein [Janthinobacterium sp.]
MDKNDDKRQQLIQEVLAPTAGMSGVDHVARSLRTWERLAAHLSPLIGEAGFCALYGRAMRLVIPQHPWLTPSVSSQPIHILLSTLKENLASIDPVNAGQANSTLLDTFTKLLSGLIGAALTTRLLNTAWADEPEGKNQ